MLVFLIVGASVFAFVRENADLIIGLAGIGLVVWLVRLALRGASSEGGSSMATIELSNAPRPSSFPVANAAPLRAASNRKFSHSGDGDKYWVADGAGDVLGPWIYRGQGLSAVNGDGEEPSLLNPTLPIDSSVVDCTQRRLEYWPTYASASPQARAAYQNWLRTGRKNPDADLGYVFLYLYGLERRILHDAVSSSAATREIPALQAELERLLEIYSNNRSFQIYAGSLLGLLQAKSAEPELYRKPPPVPRRDGELPFLYRLTLAQCAADGHPLPPEWALSWVLADQRFPLRTPARRCPAEFRQLFFLQYRSAHGDGLVLPQNRTKLKLQRRPASPGFGYKYGEDEIVLNLPDVAVLTGPIKALERIADQCCERLDSFSRAIRKDQSMAGTFDALGELPLVIWPEERRRSFEALRDSVISNAGPLAVSFEKLRASLPEWRVVNKQKMLSLYSRLEELELGMEPDLRFAGDVPTQDSTVVLFGDTPAPRASSPEPGYLAAALALQLGAAVALADDDFSGAEMDLLTKHLLDATHLTEAARQRLNARLRLLLLVPPKVTGLKARIASLEAEQREVIGRFLASIAQADAVVSSHEVKALERTFRLLGLAPESVYSQIHAAATEPVTIRGDSGAVEGHRIPRRPATDTPEGIRLDLAKVARLQADSERVAVILGSIFSDGSEPSQIVSLEDPEPDEPEHATLLGLAPEQSELLQALLGRTHWSRTELEELAADRGLMLDGAMEQLNDAAYEKFDKPILEGDDPVDVNQDLVREILKCVP